MLPPTSKLSCILFLYIAVCVTACCDTTLQTAASAETVFSDSTLYQQALADAMDIRRVDTNLTEIVPSNHNLLYDTSDKKNFEVYFIAWKDSSDLKYYCNGKKGTGSTDSTHLVFVTAEPDLKNWFTQDKKDTAGLYKRLSQLFGLPVATRHRYFVEFRLKASDIFRPCRDSSITDKACDVDFPAGVSAGYKATWQQLHDGSYRKDAPLFGKFPFTGLGYTYDWCPTNKSHMGLSEFCIKQKSRFEVVNSFDTYKYFTAKR